MAETVGLLPVGGVGSRLGPRVSRVGVPGGIDEALAAMSWKSKSSRALPHPVGTPLRHQRRARGDGAPCMELLYRRSAAVTRHPGWEAGAGPIGGP